MSKQENESSRRDFLKGSTAAVAGASLASGLSIAKSAHAASSDVIKIALVGCGGRGTGAAGQLMNTDKNVKLIAVADAFEDKTAKTLKALKQQYGSQVDVSPDRMFAGFDAYKQAIATDADLIVLATSPGFRPVHHRAAIDAGKNVFMEKPCCVDAPGYRLLMETNKIADKKGLLVGVGLQRRHQPNYIETIKRIHDGEIGDLMLLRAYWNGGGVWTRPRTAEQSEMEYQMRNWYYFVWLCGDHICEQHVHNLDVVNWAKDAHPVEASGMGGREVRKGEDHGQIFDHHFIEFTYADGTKMYSQCRHIRGCSNSVTEAILGTKGLATPGKIAFADGGEWKYSGTNLATSRAKGRRKKVKSDGGHQMEQTDLIATLRKGDRYNEGYYGATSSFTAVLGRMATYSGKVVTWDEAVEKGPQEYPYGQELTMASTPPVVPDGYGKYPVAVPGKYKPY